jgi:hypothetical protein
MLQLPDGKICFPLAAAEARPTPSAETTAENPDAEYQQKTSAHHGSSLLRMEQGQEAPLTLSSRPAVAPPGRALVAAPAGDGAAKGTALRFAKRMPPRAVRDAPPVGRAHTSTRQPRADLRRRVSGRQTRSSLASRRVAPAEKDATTRDIPDQLREPGGGVPTHEAAGEHAAVGPACLTRGPPSTTRHGTGFWPPGPPSPTAETAPDELAAPRSAVSRVYFAKAHGRLDLLKRGGPRPMDIMPRRGVRGLGPQFSRKGHP